MTRVNRLVAAVRGWSRQRQLLAGFGVLVLLVGVVVVLTHGSSRAPVALPPTPPSPSADSSVSTSKNAPHSAASSHPSTTKAKSTARARKFSCGPSSPSGAGLAAVHICIPAIKVSAQVITTGLNADRTIQVPTLAQVALASWYKYSPAPGVTGPSIILGHVDSAQYGKGVFYELGRLHSGDRVRIERADSMIATYRIDKVAQYPKNAFPTQLVYGDTAKPTVRLITCGGAFDASAGSYEDNIIAFGTLLSLRHA